MKKVKTMILGVVAMLGIGFAANAPQAHTHAHADEPEIPLSVKTYVPDKYDYYDYWGGIGDIEPEYGDGITTFAHITGLVPLKGDAIRMLTSFTLLSANSVENGGDGVDSWLTYSFSAQPGNTSDSSFPAYTNGTPGYFLHITNFSFDAVPNVVEIQFVKSNNGHSPVVASFFVDNIVTNGGVKANPEIKFLFELFKVEGKYTLKFTNYDTGAVLKEINDIELDESLFINDKGQTFFSTALYEGAGCDGKHWEHRAVKVYGFEAYTYDATNAVITLDNETFVYDGLAHRPNVSVSVNGVNLVKDVDYYTEGQSVTDIGEGKVRIYFIGDYAGNPMVERIFSVVPIDAQNAVITLSALEFTHTGNAIEPTITSVTLGDAVLVEGVDYEVSYLNNTAVGTGKVIVTFKGYYTGTVEVNFAITNAPTSETPTTEEPVTSEPGTTNPGTTAPSTGGEDKPAKTGCFGSVTASLITAATLLGIGGVLFIKRKKLM